MKKCLVILIAAITLSCSNDNSIIGSNLNVISDNSFINQDSLFNGTFIGVFQTSSIPLIPKIIIDSTPQILFASPYDFTLVSSTLTPYCAINGSPMIVASHGFKASSYYSSSNKPGRTANREIIDKDGNIHTFVFENGLFVDELLNGVSVFQ
jgi:hypothetical protein